MKLPVPFNRVFDYLHGLTRSPVHRAFPELNPDQREFLLTGLLPDEFDEFVEHIPNEEETCDD